MEILSRKSLKIYISLLKYWYQVLENTLKTNLKLLIQNVSFGITGEWMQLGFWCIWKSNSFTNDHGHSHNAVVTIGWRPMPRWIRKKQGFEILKKEIWDGDFSYHFSHFPDCVFLDFKIHNLMENTYPREKHSENIIHLPIYSF